MKATWRKRAVVTAAITIGLLPAAASAVDILMPAALLPDICPFLGGTCITWTHSSEILEVQQVLGTIENLKTAKNIGEVITVVRGDMPAIKAAIAAATPVHVADAAADAAYKKSVDDEKAAWMAGDSAATCTGALCAMQADATVNSLTAQNTATANILHEQDTAQALNVQKAFADRLTEEFGMVGQ